MLSHDQTFKNLICDYLIVALRFMLPSMTAAWPENVRVTLIRQEQPKDRLGDTFKELDVPLYVEFPDGSREALVIVIENESRDRPEFLHYLAIVCLHISLQKKTKRVVPVAFYPFRKKPLATRLTLRDDERSYLDFSCLSCVLSTMEAKEFERSRNIVARLCLPLMKFDPKDKPRMILGAYEGLMELEPDESKRIKWSEFIAIYAKMNKKEEVVFREKYMERSPFRKDIMTLAKIWKAQGKAEGKVEGKAEGMVEIVLEMYEEGVLTSQQARARLKAMLLKNHISKELVESALAKVK